MALPTSTRFDAWLRAVVPRGLALCFGVFGVLNLLGELRVRGMDGNLWWIDLRVLPTTIRQGLLLVCAGTLIAFGVLPPDKSWRRNLTLACAGVLAGFATLNVAQYYRLLWLGRLRAGLPLPLSLLVAAAMVTIVWAVAREPGTRLRRARWYQIAPVCLAWLVAFPVLQMLCFGRTDYRRRADAVIVLGARVYADGRLSDALADRTRTACQLYRDGLAPKLILSGGPGDGGIGETEAMKRLAIDLGVRSQDIVADEAGVNTRATVKNTGLLLSRRPAARVLVVSHFYHLPRIKLAYWWAGREVLTVPARENPLFLHPYNMVREVAAFWFYYFRSLTGHA